MTNNSVCFTGKRPQNMPWKDDEKQILCIELKYRLRAVIENAIEEGYNHFITGMALGVDMWAAEIIIELKKDFDISLEAAIPFKGQEAKWSEDGKNRYYRILENCDKVIYISDAYKRDCMQKRNRYMVDSSDLLIAVYNNTGGGTYQTINYARKKFKKIILVEF